MALFQSFIKEIQKASRGRKISSVGIEFGSSSIKIVHLLEEKGVIRLGNYGEIDLGPIVGKSPGTIANLDADKLKLAMGALLQNVPIKDPEAVSVAIPLSATLVIPLEIAVQEPDELEAAVLREIESKSPVPISEVYVDWQVVKRLDHVQTDDTPPAQAGNDEGVESIGTTKVICFLINKKIIDTYKEVMSSFGYSIKYFELEIYSVLRSAISANEEESIVVDIGARYTKIYVVTRGEITHAVKKLHGGYDYTQIIADTLKVDIAKAEDLKRKIDLQDMENSLISVSLEKKFDEIVMAVNHIRTNIVTKSDVPVYLCGGGSLLFGLPEYLAKKLSAKIIICQPFINTKAPDFLDSLLIETGPEYAVAAGLALKYIRNI